MSAQTVPLIVADPSSVESTSSFLHDVNAIAAIANVEKIILFITKFLKFIWSHLRPFKFILIYSQFTLLEVEVEIYLCIEVI